MKLENIKLCPQCGFPNKIEDTFCKYCEMLFQDKKISPTSGKQKGFPAFFSEKRNSAPSNPRRHDLSWLVPLILTVCLVSTGTFLFINAVIVSQGFKLWVISILLLLYGWQSFGVFMSKFKRRNRN